MTKLTINDAYKEEKRNWYFIMEVDEHGALSYNGKVEERKGIVVCLCSALSYVQQMQSMEAQTDALWYLD